jgi:hypothetical protein
VKFCNSSRPWPIFQDSFEKKPPSLLLQYFTYADMYLYVKTKLEQNVGFAKLSHRDLTFCSDLVGGIVQKSAGMWLWVYFVMRSLLEAFTYGVRTSHLREILDSLPAELEDLFQKMLSRLQPKYLEQASQIFQIFRVAPAPPSLHLLSIVDEEDPNIALQLECKPLDPLEEQSRLGSIDCPLNKLTKGLLEIKDRGIHPNDTLDLLDFSLQTTDEDKLRIRLQKHRTNNSNLLTKNIESYLPNVSRGEFWGLVVSCLGSAVRAEGTGAPPDGK